MSKHIFISYQRDSRDFVEVLDKRLRDEKFEVWWDQHVKGGQIWRDEIDKAIREAWAMVVVVTPQAKASEYVTYEWSVAIGLGKPIIPLELTETRMHPRLDLYHRLDFTNMSVRQWAELIDHLKYTQGTQTTANSPEANVDEKIKIFRNVLVNILAELCYSGILAIKSLNIFVEHDLLSPSDMKKIKETANRSN